jgi:hypothetical protein
MRHLEQTIVGKNVLFAQLLCAAAHFLDPVPERADPSLHGGFQKNPERSPHCEVMLTREPPEFEGVRRGA